MMLYGPGLNITPETTPSVKKQPEVLAAATAAGKQLGEQLRQGRDREKTTRAMQKRLMDMFAASV
jgi:hypothetical protein